VDGKNAIFLDLEAIKRSWDIAKKPLKTKRKTKNPKKAWRRSNSKKGAPKRNKKRLWEPQKKAGGAKTGLGFAKKTRPKTTGNFLRTSQKGDPGQKKGGKKPLGGGERAPPERFLLGTTNGGGTPKRDKTGEKEHQRATF